MLKTPLSLAFWVKSIISKIALQSSCVLLSLSSYLLFGNTLFIWLCQILAPELEPRTPALGVLNLSHWATSKVSPYYIFLSPCSDRECWVQ